MQHPAYQPADPGASRHRHSRLAGRYQSDGMAGSSPEKLLLAVFDRLVRDLESAAGAIADNEIELAHLALVNAQELVYELNLALAPDVWPAASELRAVYEHVMQLLVEANLNKSLENVERCLGIVRPLAATWNQAHRALEEQRLSTGPAGGPPGAVRS